MQQMSGVGRQRISSSSTNHGLYCRRLLVGGGTVLVLCFMQAGTANCHGTLGMETQVAARCVAFAYDDGGPMNYAKISLQAPDVEQMYQSAATDSRGIFCFAPDRPGRWRIVANDGAGHQHKLSIIIPDDTAGDAPAGPAVALGAGSDSQGTVASQHNGSGVLPVSDESGDRLHFPRLADRGDRPWKILAGISLIVTVAALIRLARARCIPGSRRAVSRKQPHDC